MSLDHTNFGAVSLTSFKTVVRFYLMADALLDEFEKLCVVGHVHVCLSYLDGFEIGLKLGYRS